MKISENGMSIIKGFEGFEPKPYADVTGHMTVGYGHRMKPGEICDSVDENKAEELLGEDLLWAETVVCQNVEVVLNQNQFDALVSFVYNVGTGAEGVKDGFVTLVNGRISTMLHKLNAGDFYGAAAEFPKWANAGGLPSAGLLARRKKEQALFSTPV